jgi:protein O-GlcNAc transferase
LSRIKNMLAQNRVTTPLFDTQLFTRHLELGYELIYDRFRRGLAPDHIYVPHEARGN